MTEKSAMLERKRQDLAQWEETLLQKSQQMEETVE